MSLSTLLLAGDERYYVSAPVLPSVASSSSSNSCTSTSSRSCAIESSALLVRLVLFSYLPLEH